jgi:hypothetical protein
MRLARHTVSALGGSGFLALSQRFGGSSAFFSEYLSAVRALDMAGKAE